MKKTNIDICDVCKDRIAKSKCTICEKDICNECATANEVVGTVLLTFCKECMKKVEKSGLDRHGFWKEFNEREDMKKKTIQHLKKSLMLKSLGDEEDEEDDEGFSSDGDYDSSDRDYESFSPTRKRRKKIGSFTRTIREKTI